MKLRASKKCQLCYLHLHLQQRQRPRPRQWHRLRQQLELLQVVVEVEVEVAVAPAAASFGQIEGKRRCKLQMAAEPKRRVSWETEKERERGRLTERED